LILTLEWAKKAVFVQQPVTKKYGGKMIIILNGKEEQVPKEITLYDFLKSKDADFDEIVVELNESVLETENYNKTILKENDRLEVLRFVGGG